MSDTTLFWRLAARVAQTAAERAERRAHAKPVRITPGEWEQVLTTLGRFDSNFEQQALERREQEDERLLSNAAWYVRHDEDAFEIFRAALKNPQTREVTIKLLTPPPVDPDVDRTQEYPREWLIGRKAHERELERAGSGGTPERHSRIMAED